MKEDPLRKKLLVFNYWLLKWGEEEETLQSQYWENGMITQARDLNAFLASVHTVLNRMLWMTVSASEVLENDFALFKIFNTWIAYPKGLVEIEAYGCLGNLYACGLVDRKEGSFICLRENFINDVSKITYPDLTAKGVSDVKSFEAYMEKHYPDECKLVQDALYQVFYLWRMAKVIYFRDYKKINEICRNSLWLYGYEGSTCLTRPLLNIEQDYRLVFEGDRREMIEKIQRII